MDLKDVVKFVLENKIDYMETGDYSDLKILKIIEEEVDDKIINDLKKEIEMEEDSEKYNI